jgi:hypothetical protein
VRCACALDAGEDSRHMGLGVGAKIESILITDYGLRITDFSSEISALFRVD